MEIHELVTRFTELPAQAVQNTIKLLEDDATVPFIARYRKEQTGGLDEIQIRAVENERNRVIEVLKRQETIIGKIDEQGKLTPDLRKSIVNCYDLQGLEDLYAPYKIRRKTKAATAKELGLEPLALAMMLPDSKLTQAEIDAFVGKDDKLPDTDAVIAHIGFIISDIIGHETEFRQFARQLLKDSGTVSTKKNDKLEAKAEKESKKYNQYFDYTEAVKNLFLESNSHRYLAISRGNKEKILKLSIDVETESIERKIHSHYGWKSAHPWHAQLESFCRIAISGILIPACITDLRSALKEIADSEAVTIFARNAKTILLSPPLGSKSVIGLDPGLRTGCKTVVINSVGGLTEHFTLFPLAPRNDIEGTISRLTEIAKKQTIDAIAIGNGTGGRDVFRIVRNGLKEKGLQIPVVLVNESGASIYSASDIAREEFPELDLTVRGAISIARRLQDPLAELVKIDPKSIGVGQYQHDVNQTLLKKNLQDVVEDCVNHVGIDLNTASAPLLSYVSGIGPAIAKNIVKHRENNGSFTQKDDLKEVSRLSGRVYEQAAGFLRLRQSKNKLDNTAIHPERFAFILSVCKKAEIDPNALPGNATHVASFKKMAPELRAAHGIDDYTFQDILQELEKPGLDPRQEFDPVAFRDDVSSMEDLTEGMQLQGVVTNVTNFGAFVDIGLKDDGLVHISEISHKFIKSPSEVLKPGDKVRVMVIKIDQDKGQFSLSIKQTQERPARPHSAGRPQTQKGPRGNQGGKRRSRPAPKAPANSPFAKLGDLLDKK
jgi:uncharacterized protein